MTEPLRLGAFVTTLDRPGLLTRTLELLQAQTRPPDHVLVVDNGSSSETRRVVSAFPATWIAYQDMGENLGPAGAAAYAVDRLSGQRYDWIYWGDDDDPPPSSDTIERLLKIAATTGSDTGAVGAVGAMWDWARGQIRRVPDEALTGVISVDMVGGGQQLILRREIVTNVGLPDSRLFFGFEELEYCLRIRIAGYRLLVSGDLMRECRAMHGHLDWTPPRPLCPQYPYDTIWRRYYATRNYIFLMNRTFRRPDLARSEMFKAVARACLSWERGLRFGSAFTTLQLRAIVDGYLGHMGRTVMPKPKHLNDHVSSGAGTVPAEVLRV